MWIWGMAVEKFKLLELMVGLVLAARP